MEENRAVTVDETVKIFDLQVNKQMLPSGTNPLGQGGLMKNEGRSLAMDDIPRIMIGHAPTANFAIETGEEKVHEKIAIQGTGFVREPDTEAELQLLASDNGEMKEKWEELRLDLILKVVNDVFYRYKSRVAHCKLLMNLKYYISYQNRSK